MAKRRKRSAASKTSSSTSASPFLTKMLEHRDDPRYRQSASKRYFKSRDQPDKALEDETYALLSVAILSIPGGHYNFLRLNNSPYLKIRDKAERWLERRVGPPESAMIDEPEELFEDLSPYLFRLARRAVNRIFNTKIKKDFLYKLEHRYKRAKRKKNQEELERLIGGLLAVYIDIKPKKNPFLITLIYFQLLRGIERLYHIKFDIPQP